MQTFRSITVGGLAKDALLERLHAAGVRFNAYAETLFRHPAFVPEAPAEEVRLVKTDFPGLGLPRACSYEAVLAAGAARGLRPAPLATAAFLRLEFPDQPAGPYLKVASAPLGGGPDHPTGFYLRVLEGTQWLRGFRVEGEPEWPGEQEILFRA